MTEGSIELRLRFYLPLPLLTKEGEYEGKKIPAEG